MSGLAKKFLEDSTRHFKSNVTSRIKNISKTLRVGLRNLKSSTDS